MSFYLKNTKTFAAILFVFSMLSGVICSHQSLLAEVGTAKAIHLPQRKPEVSVTEVVKAPVITMPEFNKKGEGYRLSDSDAELYERIFELQEVGNIKKADSKIEQLTDHMLMGSVLYDRYLSKYYSSSYSELAEWMKRYADYANARQIYSLALKKKPKIFAGTLALPKNSYISIGYHNDDIGKIAKPYLESKNFSGKQYDIVRAVRKSVARSPSYVLELIEKDESRAILDNTTYDALRGRIAESYFFNNTIEKAYALATVSAKRSGGDVPVAAWIAGLCSWKYKKYLQAAEFFEITAKSKRSSAWMSSAGSYWAARSYLRGRKPNKVGYWLRKAAENPRSFYGILAVKALGMEHSKFNWEIPQLTESSAKALAEFPAGKRAIGLMDSKKYDLAEGELKQVDPRKSKKIQEAMMAVAHKIGAPDFEMRLGSGLKDKDGKLYDSALYPDALWLPEGEYYIDKALIQAFIRQESKFNNEARNRSSGAMGLMQLMPSTANNVARKLKLRDSRRDYNDPKVNILVGQKYIQELLASPLIKNNLFKLAVSYNAGPGKMADWEKRIEYDNDALLFIESIPASETRVFVEKVLTNYWIYRLKYGKETNSLEQVASGDWPIYEQD